MIAEAHRHGADELCEEGLKLYERTLREGGVPPSGRPPRPHTDAAIADRLGTNVGTARVHVARLAATPGSESRAPLGHLISRPGIPAAGRQRER